MKMKESRVLIWLAFGGVRWPVCGVICREKSAMPDTQTLGFFTSMNVPCTMESLKTSTIFVILGLGYTPYSMVLQIVRADILRVA